MIKIQNIDQSTSTVSINDYIPTSFKELNIKRNYPNLQIPLLGKGVSILLNIDHCIITRSLNIPKRLNYKHTLKGKKLYKIAANAIVIYSFKEDGSHDIDKTNQKIFTAYNKLTQQLMVEARTLKIGTLEKDIFNLSSKQF